MEFGALVDNPSHYGDAQSCSNVPAKRSGLVDDSVVVLTPLEVLAVATETRLEMGGTRVAIPVGAYFIALASRWERTRQSCPLHGGSTVGDNPSGAIPTRSYTGGFEEGDHPKAVLPVHWFLGVPFFSPSFSFHLCFLLRLSDFLALVSADMPRKSVKDAGATVRGGS
jgi:hypothetical protein